MKKVRLKLEKSFKYAFGGHDVRTLDAGFHDNVDLDCAEKAVEMKIGVIIKEAKKETKVAEVKETKVKDKKETK